MSPKRGIASPRKARPNRFKSFLSVFRMGFPVFLLIATWPDLKYIQPPNKNMPARSTKTERIRPIPKTKFSKKIINPRRSNIIAVPSITNPSGLVRLACFSACVFVCFFSILASCCFSFPRLAGSCSGFSSCFPGR